MFTWHIIPHWTSTISMTTSTSIKTVFICLLKPLKTWPWAEPLAASQKTPEQPLPLSQRDAFFTQHHKTLSLHTQLTLQPFPRGLHPITNSLNPHHPATHILPPTSASWTPLPIAWTSTPCSLPPSAYTTATTPCTTGPFLLAPQPKKTQSSSSEEQQHLSRTVARSTTTTTTSRATGAAELCC